LGNFLVGAKEEDGKEAKEHTLVDGKVIIEFSVCVNEELWLIVGEVELGLTRYDKG